jgi:hypothetical protein
MLKFALIAQESRLYYWIQTGYKGVEMWHEVIILTARWLPFLY